MPIYPRATLELWYPYSPERPITPRSVILHTNASGGAENPGSTGGLSWHFQVGEHGTVYQHRDTATRAAANVQANDFAISIETWDDGSPDVGVPWNPEQMSALVDLIGWICDTHAIPRRKVTTWDGWGIGYHRMFSEWNQPVHSCPGDTRAAQFDSELIPRLTTPPAPPPQEDSVAIASGPNDELLEGGIAPDGTFWFRHWTGSAWLPDWVEAPGHGQFKSGPAVAILSNGDLHLAAKGLDDALWRQFWQKASNKWSGWFSDGGKFK